ncbi:hypothetical protein TCAL_06134 [Tigriopus californicus]|uniref:Uncharacterized protein n=1 Tax=Tigriopus californicus TaxID=6832 RepID=A0A553NYV8_TIGCA|nr:uncharacterized protein LOC131887383 [Tigriopus californicus]TRY70620.1 hypothetical protein TCAL_06134 [Tigriopus californicus]|eukprot:TCALIF_06134-PA protein Name:"Protein of unknown function" AED:0.81 eAED:0.81 QI:182/1/0.66/1/1/1/3/0/1248
MEPRLLAFILFGLGTLDLSLGITGAAEEFSKRLSAGQDFHQSGQIQDFDFSKFFPDIEKTHPAPSKHESRALPTEESADMYGGYSASQGQASIETYDQLEDTFKTSLESQPEERQAFQIPSEFQSFDGPAVEPAALTAAEGGFLLPSDFNLPGPLPESGGSISGPEFSVPTQFRDTESFEEPEQLRNPGQFALPREVTGAGNLSPPFDGFSAPFGSSNSFLNLLGNSNLGAFGGSNFGKRLDRKGSQEQSEDRSPPGFSREPKKRFTLQDEIDIVKKYQKKQAQTASLVEDLKQSRQSPNTFDRSNGFGPKFELSKFERPNEDLSGALDSFEPSYEKYDFQENFQSRFQDQPAYSYEEPENEPPKSNEYRTEPKVIDTFGFGPRHNNPSNNNPQFRTPNKPSNHFQYDYDQEEEEEEREAAEQPSLYRGYSNEQDSFREETEENQAHLGGTSGFGPGYDSFAPEFDSTENPESYQDYDRPKRFNPVREPTYSTRDRGFVSTFDSPNPFGGSSIGLSPPTFVNPQKTAQQLTPKEDYQGTRSSFGQGGGFPSAYFGGQFTEEELDEPVAYSSPQEPFFTQQRENFPQRSREPESRNPFHFSQPASSENSFSSYAREASKTYPSYREPDHSQTSGYDSDHAYDAVPNSYETKLVDLRSKIFDGQKFDKFGFAEKSGPVYQDGFKDRSGEEVEFVEDSSDEPREPSKASSGAVNPVEYSFRRFAGYPGFPETLASTTVLDSRTEPVTEKMPAEVPYTHQEKTVRSKVESSPYERPSTSKLKEETEHFRPQESKESFQHHFEGFNFGSSGYEKAEKQDDTYKQQQSSEATTEPLPSMEEHTSVYEHRDNHGSLESYDVSRETNKNFKWKKEGSSKKKYDHIKKKFDPSQEKKHQSPFKLKQKSSFREPTKSESFETVDVAFDASTALSNPTIAPEMTTPQPTLDYPNTKFVAPTPEEGFKPMGGSTKILDTLLQETVTSTPLPPTTYEYTEISFREPITSTLANEEGHSQPPFSTTKPTKGPIYYKSFKQSSSTSKETIRSFPSKSSDEDVIDVLADSHPRARPKKENHSGEFNKPYRRSYSHMHNAPPARGSPKNKNPPPVPKQQKPHHRPNSDKQQRLVQHLQSQQQQQQQQAQLSRPQKPNGPVPRRQRINQNQRLKSMIKQHLPKRRPNGQIRANLPGGLTLNWPPKNKNKGPVAKNMAKNIRRVTDLFSSKDRDQRKPKANIRQVSAVVLPYVAGAMVSSPLVAAII